MALSAAEQAELDQLEAGITTPKAPPQDLNMNPSTDQAGNDLIQGVSDFATKGDPNHKFDTSQIATGAATGGIIGAGLGAIGGPAGALAGGAAGTALGALGSLAEETVRTLGGSELASLVAGFAAGGLPSLAKSGLTSLARGVAPASAAYLPRWARAGLGLGREMGQEGMTVGERKALDATLGKKVAKVDFEAMPAFQDNQKLLTDQLAKSGINVPEGQKVSTFVRDNLYSTMTNLRDSGKPFVNSQAFKDLNSDLSEQLALKQINKSDVDTIKQLARSQTDVRPGVVGQSNQALLNLSQNGGKFNNKTGEAEKLISDKAQELLSNRFNQYFTEAGQGDMYNTLKSVERSEYVAKTLDSLPLIFLNKAKPSELGKISANINATPEGKKLFINGFGSYLSGIPAGNSAKMTGEKVLSEFKRLAPTVASTGLMTRQELNQLQQTIMAIPKTLSAARWKEIADHAITSSLSTGVPAQLGQGSETP